jgi:choline-glycine betaine transporter
MMMFMSAGAGTGLIYYGVGEPIYHLSYNRYVSTGNMNYNELSQQAMNLTYYHWGVHAWMCYTMFAIVQGIVSHRMGLPLTIRSCFFPIFGSKIYGKVDALISTQEQPPLCVILSPIQPTVLFSNASLDQSSPP